LKLFIPKMNKMKKVLWLLDDDDDDDA